MACRGAHVLLLGRRWSEALPGPREPVDKPTHTAVASAHTCSRWSRDSAQLLHKRQVVVDAPVLDHLSLFEPQDVDVLHGERTVRRCQPHDLAGVRALVSEMHNHGVALLDRPVHLEALVRKGRIEHPHCVVHAFETLRLTGSGGVVDAVGGDDFGSCVQIHGRKDLLPQPASLGLVLRHLSLLSAAPRGCKSFGYWVERDLIGVMTIPSNQGDVKPRRYRSQLRKAQAAATRGAIVDAALAVFLENGYAGATMQKIAESAGVVVETIYRAFGGKAGLFKAAVQAAVAGGTERAERPVEQRPAIRAVIDESDPHRKIELYVDTQPGIHSRLGPLYRTLAEAAAVQPELAEIWEELETQRLHGLARFAQHLAEAGALRQGVTVDGARDVLWTINSHDVHRMLVIERGWSPERYRHWLAEMLACALLP